MHESLKGQGFCLIFTVSKEMSDLLIFKQGCFLPAKKSRQQSSLRNLKSLPALIFVTDLWTPCTRLKIRNLQTAIFD
jgi:hypothetical protein